MALGDRKSSDIFNTRTGESKDSKSIDETDKSRIENSFNNGDHIADFCLLYTSPSPRDRTRSRMPSSA